MRRYLPWLALALPLMLLGSTWRTLAELEHVRDLYLRSQAANIAARLETLPPEADPAAELDERGLYGVAILSPEAPGADRSTVESLARGESLFHSLSLRVDGAGIMRFYIPIHWQGEWRVARIDLERAGADFLLAHTRHHVVLATVTGLALIALLFYVVWADRRQARLEHLAHLGKMSAVLAHEIRNPLGAIKGFAQLALETADAATGSMIQPVVEETHRLERLVNDLLLYGRSPEPRAADVDTAGFVASFEAYARDLIRERPIQYSSQAVPARLRTDPDLLKQAVLNLLRNAIEAQPDGRQGRVALHLERSPGGQPLIVVEDDGPGLPPDVRTRLFQPFVTTKASGTGLGLSISKKLVEALGGRIAVKDRAPGTRVELILPKECVQWS